MAPQLLVSVPLALGNGRVLEVSFQRTLRIPDDGKDYPLPPSLGHFPLVRATDLDPERLPEAWRGEGHYVLPMHQREALWLSFSAAEPAALMVAAGGINAVSGEGWDARLRGGKGQNYLVVPDQPWLDGIASGDGFIRQFVAVPLGSGYTVEGQMTGEETEGGVQLRAFPALPGRIPPRPPMLFRGLGCSSEVLCCAMEAPAAMGLAAGGRMRQQVDEDPYGPRTWDRKHPADATVHIVNSEQWRGLTGEEPPATPIDAATYTQHGFPWFDLYREEGTGIAPSGKLDKVKSVAELDGDGPDATVPVPGGQVVTYGSGESWPK